MGAVMATIIVVLASSKPVEELSSFRKDVAAFWRCQISDSVWLIDSELPIDEIRDELTRSLSENDGLFLGYLYPRWLAWKMRGPKQWLLRPTRRWLRRANVPFLKRFFGE